MAGFARDNILGCIVGGAIGDAVGGVPERARLALSDDTQLTLATCEAITAAVSVSPEAIAGAFLRWFRRRALSGLGSSTLKALRDLDAGNHWALSGARGEKAAGNGAAMRVAPLAFLLNPLDSADRVVIRDVCSITHHSDEAYIGALAVLIALHLPALPVPQALRRIVGALPDSRVRDRVLSFAELPSDIPLAQVAERFGASGYVVETVPLALLTALRLTRENFEAILDELVQAGGDTDTIGAIAGQIAGARLGLSGLPPRLVELAEVQAGFPTAEAFARKVLGGT